MEELEYLNSATLDDLFFDVMQRLMPDAAYEIIDGNGEIYERLKLLGDEEKPPLIAFEEMFITVKNDLIEAAQARLNEKNRVNALRDRIAALSVRNSSLPCFHKIVQGVPNAHKYLKELVHDKSRAEEAEALLAQMENEQSIFDAEVEAEKVKKEKKEKLPKYEEFLEAFVLMQDGKPEEMEKLIKIVKELG